MASPQKRLPPRPVTLATPGGNTLTVQSDEVDLIDLELADDLLDPNPPEGWTESRQLTVREKRQLQRYLKSFATSHLADRDAMMIQGMKSMMDQAEKAMKLDRNFEGTYLLAKNSYETMVCHRNHGEDLWEACGTSASEQGKSFVHQENMKDAWIRGREVEEFISEQL